VTAQCRPAPDSGAARSSARVQMAVGWQRGYAPSMISNRVTAACAGATVAVGVSAASLVGASTASADDQYFRVSAHVVCSSAVSNTRWTSATINVAVNYMPTDVRLYYKVSFDNRVIFSVPGTTDSTGVFRANGTHKARPGSSLPSGRQYLPHIDDAVGEGPYSDVDYIGRPAASPFTSSCLPTTVAGSGAGAVKRNSRHTLQARLTSNGNVLRGAAMQLVARTTAKGPFKVIATRRTGRLGYVRATFEIRRTTVYQWRYLGTSKRNAARSHLIRVRTT
jgi:hypothetical protein